MSGLSCYVPRKCRKLRKRRYSNAPMNENPERGRGRGIEGKGCDAQDNGSIWAFACGTGAICVVVIHKIFQFA